jgi:hypothetical protein
MCKNRRKGLTTRLDFPNIQAAQTALKYETEVSDGGRLELKTPKGYAKARSFRCAGVPDDMSDSGGGIRKRPDFGMARSMIRDWNDFVRLGGTTFGGICGLLTD